MWLTSSITFDYNVHNCVDSELRTSLHRRSPDQANIVHCCAAYGTTAIVAKTEEELEDRRQALFGDYDTAEDVVVNLPATKEDGHMQNGGNQLQNGGHAPQKVPFGVRS